jgi:hypothetical protein
MIKFICSCDIVKQEEEISIFERLAFKIIDYIWYLFKESFDFELSLQILLLQVYPTIPCDLEVGPDHLTFGKREWGLQCFFPRQICYFFYTMQMHTDNFFLHILPKFVFVNCSVSLFIIFYLKKKSFIMQFVNEDTPSI